VLLADVAKSTIHAPFYQTEKSFHGVRVNVVPVDPLGILAELVLDDDVESGTS